MRRHLYVLTVLLITAMASAAGAQQQPATPPQVESQAQPATPPSQTPAGAQTPGTLGTINVPTFEVGLGYQFLRAGGLCLDDDDNGGDDGCEGRNFPLGFAIDGVRNFGRVGLVGELGWSRDSDEFTIDTDPGTLSENLFHYAAGVRVTGHNAGRAWPYGQILFGGVTSRTSFNFDEDVLDDAIDAVTDTRFMIQPGVGITVVGGDGWGVFGQLDYRRVFLGDDDDDGGSVDGDDDDTDFSGRNDFRIFLGVRVILD